MKTNYGVVGGLVMMAMGAVGLFRHYVTMDMPTKSWGVPVASGVVLLGGLALLAYGMRLPEKK